MEKNQIKLIIEENITTLKFIRLFLINHKSEMNNQEGLQYILHMIDGKCDYLEKIVAKENEKFSEKNILLPIYFFLKWLLNDDGNE